MNRQVMRNSLEKEDKNLFESIKNNPVPDPRILWALSEERFIEWRKIHDFPKLLNHFDKRLIHFVDWKKTYNITNEEIIETGCLTPFLENKKLSPKDKVIFLIKQTGVNLNKTIVSYRKVEGDKNDFGENFNYEVIKSFTSYLDWLHLEKAGQQKILEINERHAPETDRERVFIHSDIYSFQKEHELLKMGGVDLPVNGFNILNRGKKLEFVNLCGLRLKGTVYFGELGNLSCSYCACDNWQAEHLDMSLLLFEHCSLGNFSIKGSRIQQWKFYNCNVSGTFVDSRLAQIQIYGGRFAPIVNGCTIFNVEIEQDHRIEDNNYYGYKLLKRLYSQQGDDDSASKYFIRENEAYRKKLKGVRYLTKSLSFLYWKYGKAPHRIIYFSLVVIVLFALIYWSHSNLIQKDGNGILSLNFWNSLYFSTITFTTLGYNDLSPEGSLRAISAIESVIGVLNMGFLISGYTNTKY